MRNSLRENTGSAEITVKKNFERENRQLNEIIDIQVFLAEVGEGSEDGEGEEIPEDAEDDPVDADVEGHLRDHVVSAVDQLHHHHRSVGPPRRRLPSGATARRSHRRQI